MRKITIANHTAWKTKDIRHLISVAASWSLDPGDLPLLRVEVKPGRTKHCRGYAYYNNNVLRLNLPKDSIDKCELAQLVVLFLAFCTGRKNRTLTGAKYKRKDNWRTLYAWAEQLELGKDTGPAKLTSDAKLEAKLEQHQKKIAEWKTKQKRATTMLKKYQKKLKYYEKRQAAAAAKIQNRKDALIGLLDLDHVRSNSQILRA